MRFFLSFFKKDWPIWSFGVGFEWLRLFQTDSESQMRIHS